MNDLLLADPKWVREYTEKMKAAQQKLDPAAGGGWFSPAQSVSEQVGSIMSISAAGAVININGLLTPLGPTKIDAYFGEQGTSYAAIREAFQQADRQLSAELPIDVFGNSPGGTVAGCEETGSVIREIAAKRQVTFHAGYRCTSAMYWLASCCSKINAIGQTSAFGSIGVLVSGWDTTKYLEKWGITVYNLTNKESRKKAADLATQEGREVIIDQLDEYYQVFLSTVLEGRSGSISKEQVESLEGIVVLADRAKEVGLIDEIENAIKTDSNINNNTATGEEAGANNRENKMSLKNQQTQQPSAAAPTETEQQPSAAAPTETEQQQAAAATTETEQQQAAAAPTETEQQQAAAAPTETEQHPSASLKAFAKPYLGNANYPQAIQSLAADVLCGDAHPQALTAAVKAFDSMKQQGAIKNATQTASDPTPSEMPSANGNKNIDEQTTVLKGYLHIN